MHPPVSDTDPKVLTAASQDQTVKVHCSFVNKIAVSPESSPEFTIIPLGIPYHTPAFTILPIRIPYHTPAFTATTRNSLL